MSVWQRCRRWLGARAVAIGIVLCLFGTFMALGSREPPWGDARIMVQVAERIEKKHRIDIEKEWPPMSHKGADGRNYSQYAIGPSLAHVPGVKLRRFLDRRFKEAKPLTKVVTSHLSSAVFAALACALFFGVCRRLGVGLRGASVATLALAFGTSLFVYARSPFSEAMQAACFIGLLGAVLRVEDEPTAAHAAALGAWAGALLNAKLIFALSIAGAGAYLLVALWRAGDRAALARVAAWGVAAFAPFAALALWYNHARWGGVFDTGYDETLDLVRERWSAGVYGLLLSPGKSVFLYSPPIVLGVLCLRRLARQRAGTGWLFAAILLPPLLIYGRFLAWSGDYCWGPRYLVYALAPLMLAAALWLDDIAEGRMRALGKWAVTFVCAAGVFVQLLGAAFYWDLYIRVAMHAREQWLGRPNRAGAAIERRAQGRCHACFEDMHGHQWLPPFSPIEGHFWLLRHVPFDHPWERAERDAPWKRYTNLELGSVASVYEAVRVDWWGNRWWGDKDGDDEINAQTRRLGRIWMTLFVAFAVAGGALWWIGLRRRRVSEADTDEPVATA